MNFVEKQGFKEIIDLFYCGLLNGTREPDFDRRDVVDWIEDLQETEEGEKEIQKVFEAYLDSRQVGQMLEAAEKITAEINSKKQEEDTKKK